MNDDNILDYSDEIQMDVNWRDRMGPDSDVLGTVIDRKHSFTSYVEALCRKLKSRGVTPFKEHEIQYIMTRSKDVPDPHMKNATAFVLGYAVVSQSRVDKAKFKAIVANVPANVDVPSMKASDVLRYARLWIYKLHL